MDLSIIILTWNTKDYLVSLLNSIIKNNNDCKFEVIVVDNGSSDGVGNYLRDSYPDVIFIRNETNLGTSQRNRGLEIAKGKYFAFLDSDIELLMEHTFDILIEHLDKNPGIGLISPKLILDNGEVQLSCKKFSELLYPNFKKTGFYTVCKKDRII